jgi:hypothetical protein
MDMTIKLPVPEPEYPEPYDRWGDWYFRAIGLIETPDGPAWARTMSQGELFIALLEQ